MLQEGQEFNFTIKSGVSSEDTVSVNYDDFVNDVEVGDILLVDGKYKYLEYCYIDAWGHSYAGFSVSDWRFSCM